MQNTPKYYFNELQENLRVQGMCASFSDGWSSYKYSRFVDFLKNGGIEKISVRRVDNATGKVIEYKDSIDTLHEIGERSGDQYNKYSYMVNLNPFAGQPYSYFDDPKDPMSFEIFKEAVLNRVVGVWEDHREEWIIDNDRFYFKGEDITENSYLVSKCAYEFFRQNPFSRGWVPETEYLKWNSFKHNGKTLDINKFKYVKRNFSKITAKSVKKTNHFFLDIDYKDEDLNNKIFYLGANLIIETPHGWRLGFFFKDYFNLLDAKSMHTGFFFQLHNTLKKYLKADNINPFSQFFFLPTKKKGAFNEEKFECEVFGKYIIRHIGEDFYSLDQTSKLFYCYSKLFQKLEKDQEEQIKVTTKKCKSNPSFFLTEEKLRDLLKEKTGEYYIRSGKRNEYYLYTSFYAKKYGWDLKRAWEFLTNIHKHPRSNSKDWHKNKKKCEQHFLTIWKLTKANSSKLYEKHKKLYENNLKKLSNINKSKLAHLTERQRNILKHLIISAALFGKKIPIYSQLMRALFGKNYFYDLKVLEENDYLQIDHSYSYNLESKYHDGICRRVSLLLFNLLKAKIIFKKTYNLLIKALEDTVRDFLLNERYLYKPIIENFS